MLGLLLIYFIGKRFYDLSEAYNQNKWLYAVLSIVVYYAATFVVGIILAVLIESGIVDFDLENTFIVTLIALPFGLGALYLFYTLLEKKWKKAGVLIKDEIHDIGRHMDE